MADGGGGGGGGGGGKNYVLVHGSCHGAFCWEEVIKHMEKQGKRAYALDLPGHGDRIPERPNVRYDDYPNAVVEFIEGRDLNNVVLVGHSMAGIVIPKAVWRTWCFCQPSS